MAASTVARPAAFSAGKRKIRSPVSRRTSSPSTGSTWDVKVTAAACSTLVGVDNTVGREDPVEILVFSDYL